MEAGSPPLVTATEDLHDAEASMEPILTNTHHELRRLRHENAVLTDNVAALQKGLTDLPELERMVLYQAERAEALEGIILELQERNGRLEVLAHARARASKQLTGAGQIRILLSCIGAEALRHALHAWHEVAVRERGWYAALFGPPSRVLGAHDSRLPAETALAAEGPGHPPPTPSRNPGQPPARAWGDPDLFGAHAADIAALEYQNLLLQRAAAQQAKLARHEAGATLLLATRRHHDVGRLGEAWRDWVAAPPELAEYASDAAAGVPAGYPRLAAEVSSRCEPPPTVTRSAARSTSRSTARSTLRSTPPPPATQASAARTTAPRSKGHK
jgi:hypothetical protein